MPLPGPTSKLFYNFPMWFQKASVLFNHFVELIVPFFYFGPRLFRNTAGALTVFFQAFIIASGNFSWLNHISIVIALSCFDDGFFQSVLPFLTPWAKALGVAGIDTAIAITGGLPAPILYTLTAVIAYLSLNPARNLVSRTQVMNTSFDPLRLVNTYGAFGSITKTRDEVILSGSDSRSGPWTDYHFKGKPGDVSRTPPLVSPYHYKLDWQMWFAAMSPYYYHPWILSLVGHLLEGDPQTLSLMGKNPFPSRPPKYIRADLYEYHYTQFGDKDTWKRTYKGQYLPPLSLDDPNFRSLLEQQGWLDEKRF